MSLRTYLAETGYWFMVFGVGFLGAGAAFAGAFIASQTVSMRIAKARSIALILQRASLPLETTSNKSLQVSSGQRARSFQAPDAWRVLGRLSMRYGSGSARNVAVSAAFRWFARSVTGPRYLVRADDLLQRAGLDSDLQRSDVELASGLAGAIGLLLPLGASMIWNIDTSVVLVTLTIGAFAGARAPLGMLRRRAKALQQRLQRDVVSMLDMLALATSAGLSFDRAVEEYSRRANGELAHLMAAAHARWMSGAVSRESALNEVARAVDLDAYSRITAALTQSITLGSALSSAIESYAQDVREQRRNAIESEIGKAPVKMLLPLGGFILPAMLILLFTPILAQVFDGLSGGW